MKLSARRTRGARPRRERKERGRDEKTRTAYSHPLFGDIPLIEKTTEHNGKLCRHFEYDPAFKPKMPPRAAPGDISKQVCLWEIPHYFYVDEERKCPQCDSLFVFSAREQKFWCERLKIKLSHTHAIRCLSCRRQRRNEKALRAHLAEAVRAAAEHSRDPHAQIALCEATLTYFQRFGAGNLNRAIAAARTAYRLDSSLREALYWEAACHDAAGRGIKARAALEKFVERARPRGRYQRLVRRSEARIAEMQCGSIARS